MKHSYREAIKRLSEGNVCCPNCASRNLVSRERQIPCSDQDGKPVFHRRDQVFETFDSHRCESCGQHFTTSVEIVWCCAVEYVNDVGDKLRPDEPTSTMI